jgi:hypothetical protein
LSNLVIAMVWDIFNVMQRIDRKAEAARSNALLALGTGGGNGGGGGGDGNDDGNGGNGRARSPTQEASDVQLAATAIQ